jgi:hypothetical protein
MEISNHEILIKVCGDNSQIRENNSFREKDQKLRQGCEKMKVILNHF